MFGFPRWILQVIGGGGTAALPFASEAFDGDFGGIWVREGVSGLRRSLGYEPYGTGVGWPPRYLDVLPKKVCIEAEPVRGDVKPSLDEDVSLERAGTNCKAERGAWQTVCRILPPPCPSHAVPPTFQHALLRRDVLEQLVVLGVVLASSLKMKQSKVIR